MKLLYKIIVLPIVFLFLVYSIMAVNNEQQHNITSINFCVGKIDIKVQAEAHLKPLQYSILDCTELEEMFWKCECLNPTTLVLLYDDEMIENEFDFIIEYHVEELFPSDGNETHPGKNDIYNDGIKRTTEITNVKINKGGPKFKFPEWTTGNTTMIVISISVIIIIVIGLVVIAVIWVMRSDENKIEKEEERKPKVIDVEPNDESVDEFLESITK